MSYGLFPRQKLDKDFMRTYKAFCRKYYAHYYREANRHKNRNYTIRTPGDSSNRFLIYIPEMDSAEFFIKTTDIFIIFVEFKTSREILYKETGELTVGTVKEAHYLPFDFENEQREDFQKEYSSAAPIPYDKIDSKYFKVNTLYNDGIFCMYNPSCVFQLQPEHFHYFAPYFKDFVPFQKVFSNYQRHTLKSATPPTNLLLS